MTVSYRESDYNRSSSHYSHKNKTAHRSFRISKRLFSSRQILHKVHCKLGYEKEQHRNKSPKRSRLQKVKYTPYTYEQSDRAKIYEIYKTQSLILKDFSYSVIVLLNGIQIRTRHKKCVNKHKQYVKPITS